MPVFEYADTDRLERLLKASLRFSILVLALSAVVTVATRFIVQNANLVAQLIVILAAALLFILVAFFLYLRQVRFSALFLPIAMWVLVTYLTVSSGGVRGPGFAFYIVVIFLANMLLGIGAGAIFFVISFFTSLAIIYADGMQLLPPSLLGPSSVVTVALAYWLVLIWLAGLIFITNRDLRQILARTRRSEQAVRENNLELQKARVSLQTYARALERRIVHLQVAAEIARDAASMDHLDELLVRSVNLVRDRFGFYHAGIFLLEGEYAVLRAATGDAGEKLLANGHRLKIGEVGIVGYVAGSGQPRIALDVGADAAYFRNPHLPETRSEMAVPLMVGTQNIGVLDVQSRLPNAFQSEDVSIVQILADQLAIAIVNTRLFESAKRRLDELTILHRVGMAATEATNPDELIERATLLIGEKLYPDNFGILLVDEDAGFLRFHPSYHGLDDDQKKRNYPFGHGVIGRVASQGKELRVTDITREPAYVDIHAGMHSELCVPLKVGGQVIGVINAESNRPNAFTEGDERLLLTLSGQLATSIEKARLFNLATRRAEALEALRRAGLQLTANLEPEAVLEAILQYAIKLIASDTGRIYLYDGKQLTFGTSLWAEGVKPLEHKVPRPNGLTYTVARTGRRIAVSNTREHALFKDIEWMGAVVGLPLRCGDQVSGVMVLTFEGRSHQFDDFELRVLDLFADQASSALMNAQLYAESQERAKALSLALAEREELDHLKDEMIQNVSHELRTPVAIIRGYADLLEQGELGDLQTSQKDAISVINRRIVLLAKLVDDLTVMMESEARSPVKEPVNLVNMVRGAVEDFKTSVEKAGLSLVMEVANYIPVLEGNLTHLTRMIDNLINNAIKFTPQGGFIMISLSYDEDDTNIILQVCDSGVGIPQDKLERIFDRFYQVDGSTTRRFGGTGLGLALVKEIAEAHGGSVEVKSIQGEGSVFTVRLPVETAPTRIFNTNET